MRLTIHSPDVSIPSANVRAFQRHVQFALDRLEHAVREVRLTIRDENGPRGGSDKRCVMRVQLFPRGMLVVTKTSHDYLHAISLAVDSVRNALEKRRHVRRKFSKYCISDAYST